MITQLWILSSVKCSDTGISGKGALLFRAILDLSITRSALNVYCNMLSREQAVLCSKMYTQNQPAIQKLHQHLSILTLEPPRG